MPNKGSLEAMVVNEAFPRKIRDTPCARCSHAHAGQSWPYYERCGEWMSEWLLTGAGFWMCECPEWVQPELCVCGQAREKRAYLFGIRACSSECAQIVLEREIGRVS